MESCRDFIVNTAYERTYMDGKLEGSRYSWVFYLRNGLFRTDFLMSRRCG